MIRKYSFRRTEIVKRVETQEYSSKEKRVETDESLVYRFLPTSSSES